MSPILTGIVASGISGHLSTNSFESIQTVTVGAGGSSTISFSSIPSTFKHLQIRYLAVTASGGNVLVQVGNGSPDTGSNYSRHQLYGDGSSAGATATTSTNGMNTGYLPGTSNYPGAGIADLLDYANTNKNKTLRSLGGGDVNGAGGYISLWSGLWLSTSAINTIQITCAGSFNQYSSFALYGIKG